jgi:hypothetical protein
VDKMTHYGELLDKNFDPTREFLYQSFTRYFDNPTMTKIKDVDEYSLYMCKIYTLLGIEYRYIVVFVHKDQKATGEKEKLDQLCWVSLQTRTLNDEHDEHDFAPHSYIPTRLPILNKKITLTFHDKGQYLYKVDDLPLRVTLLPQGKMSFGLEYNPTGSLITALETYNTIVSFY